MKTSSYIIDYLYKNGVTHIFEVIGGMTTHLVDSAYKHGQIKLISTHHEQSAAFAAGAMARITGIPGVAMATSGPGAINLLTGIGDCFFDSVPAIFITGQVNLREQKGSLPIRQLGFQETDIVNMARPITKAVWKVESVEEIPSILDEAFRISLSGRPGPVLIDIPMDVQRSEIQCIPSIRKKIIEIESFDSTITEQILIALNQAKAPLILVGGGIHSARALDLFREFVGILKIPVVNSLMAVDALPYNHPMRVGLIGTYGNRWANQVLGNYDVLLVLGSRLDIRQTGNNLDLFQLSGRTIYHVDCDKGEINNRIRNCVSVLADLKVFLSEAINIAKEIHFEESDDRMTKIDQLRNRWPDTQEIKNVSGINPNKFMHELSSFSGGAGAYTVDVGNHQMWAAQSIEVRINQCYLTGGGMGSMGFSLPSAIGASFACPGKPIVQISGDGGMQLNIQELQTIKHHKLPIKMIVLNNHSLGMVRQFQQSYFNNRYQSTIWGYSAPEFCEVSKAYGIPAIKIQREDEIDTGLMQLWENPHAPFLLEVEIDKTANAYPKISFDNQLTEMDPRI